MKRKNTHELVGRVADFGRSATSGFDLKTLVRHLRGKGIRESEDDIYKVARASESLLEFEEDGCFVPRHIFFQNAQFRITPLQEEVEGGYLVPGHRFIPFVARTVFPADARLVMPDGTSVATRKVFIPQALAMAYLHFYGPSGAIEYLLFESEANAERLMPPFEAEVELTVFDLRDYFRSSGFRHGDSLMLTVVDWQKGVYSFARIEEDSAISDLTAVRKWTASLKDALDDALDELSTDGDCYEQLALAMRNAQEEEPEGFPLMQSPPLALAAFFNMQQELEVTLIGDRALFWETGDDPLEDALLDSLEDPEEPETELDAFFQELGLSLSEDEVEAYMRDALFFGGKNADAVLARVSSGRMLLFDSAEDQERFHQLWNGLWNGVKAGYDSCNDPFGEIRARFLALNDKALATMRQLDARGTGMEIAGNPAFFEFGHLTGLLSNALILFNLPDDGSAESSNGLMAMLPTLETAVEKLSARLLKQDGPKKKKGAKKAARNGAVYQLKVTLKGSKPPIWRRILVSSSMELAELHDAIQAAMGWSDSHLHQFKQGRTFYLPEPDDEFLGFETEGYAGVCIGDLLRKEKQKIQYEYDFGDSWEHEVLLEKVLEPEADVAYPVCIKGKGACPPEDCGGLWGYYNLLEILGDPEHEEYEDMQDWVGASINPEAFDLDETNARMRQWCD